jgi:hypothetical protein
MIIETPNLNRICKVLNFLLKLLNIHFLKNPVIGSKDVTSDETGGWH